MRTSLGVWFLAMVLLAGCGDDGEDSTNQSGGQGGSGGSGQHDAGSGGDDAGDDGDDGDEKPGDGKGVQASGSFNGEPVEITCAPPSDLAVGRQFLYQNPAGLFHLFSFRCRTASEDVQIWFDVSDPEAGETYVQPDAGDKFGIQLGNPSDVQPLGRLAENLVEMKVTIDAVDIEKTSMKGSFSAKWEGGEKYGEIAGTFDVEEWE